MPTFYLAVVRDIAAQFCGLLVVYYLVFVDAEGTYPAPGDELRFSLSPVLEGLPSRGLSLLGHSLVTLRDNGITEVSPPVLSRPAGRLPRIREP